MKSVEELEAENQSIRDLLRSGSEASLRGLPGVVHVSIGVKETQGRLVHDELCVRVYVKEKKSRDHLPPAQRIPERIAGVPTDVHTVAHFEFQADNTRYRPIKGGTQVTNRIVNAASAGATPNIVRGTMGCAAIDTTNDDEVLLSSWHVLTAHGGTTGDKVFQPAPLWLPTLTAAQLPFRPPDDADKVAKVKRSVISPKVDAAIARIDVSSCCHCCGIHYSNEIHGLSATGGPPRGTIVDDQAAAAGMTVFKVGQATLRTKGVVVDANYPSFPITVGGTTYTFNGQIAIQNVDNTKQFSDVGDSGAVVINDQNKIVGLLFAGGRGITQGANTFTFLSLANHISDVFSELKVRIPYSADVVVTASRTLLDVPANVLDAAIPEPYQTLRQRLEQHERTAVIAAIGQRHAEEITHLVNHCRPVTVAWHRNHGPAWLATVMGAVRDGHCQLPGRVKDVALHEGLERMRAVLREHGSPALRESMSRPEGDLVLDAIRDCRDLNQAIARIAGARTASVGPVQ